MSFSEISFKGISFVPNGRQAYFEHFFPKLVSLARTVASLARTVPESCPTNSLFVLWLVLHVFDRVGWDGMLSWQDGGRFSKLVNLGVYQF